MSSGSKETPGTVFTLNESLGFDSSQVSRNFTAFQDGSSHSVSMWGLVRIAAVCPVGRR